VAAARLRCWPLVATRGARDSDTVSTPHVGRRIGHGIGLGMASRRTPIVHAHNETWGRAAKDWGRDLRRC